MKERKRNRNEIIFDMLRIIKEKGKLKPTHLMYKANLSHIQMNAYLSEMIGNKLVEKISNENKSVISITKKGKEFVDKFSEIREFEKTFGL